MFRARALTSTRIWTDRSLRSKGFVVLAIPLAALLMTNLAFTLVRQRESSAQRWVNHTLAVRDQIDSTELLLLDAEAGMLGYLLTGDPSLLAPYQAAQQQYPLAIARLRDLMADNPLQLDRLGQLDQLAGTQFAALAAEAGQPPSSPLAAPSAFTEESQGRLTAVWQQAAAMRLEEDRLLAVRTARRDRAEFWSKLVLGGSVLLGLGGGVLAMLVLTRGIVARVHRLEANARRLVTRQPLWPLPPSRDEVGQLGVVLAEVAGLLAERDSLAAAAAEASRRDAERLAAVVATQQAVVTAGLEMTDLMTVVAERCQALTRAGGAAIELVEGEEMVYRAASGTAAPFVGLRLGVAGSLSGLSVRTGEILRCDDAQQDPRADQNACQRLGLRSMIVVPLAADGQVVGVLKVLSPQPRAFDEMDVSTVQLMAGLIAAALSQALAFATKQALVADLQVEVSRRVVLEAELTAARDSAEQANRAKSAFLSRMSHELRTPLNAILGFGQLLAFEELSADQRDSVDHITRAGRHLLALINEVLDLARIEAGRLPLSTEPVHAAEVIQEALDLVRPAAAAQQLQLVPPSGSACCARHVMADRQRLTQVLLNLLSNAIKYNRPGGMVRLTCQEVPGDRLRLSVTDSGRGIAPEALERVFVPFDRLDAQSWGIEGTGLGLPLARQLTEAMNGTMGVESQPERGSTFWLELPLTQAPLERLQVLGGPVFAPPAGPQQERTVLYIEDNLSNLALVERLLADWPTVRLLSALQGSLGFELARQHQPDLILLDRNLPDGSGDALLDRLQADPHTRGIPVVIISADASSGQVERLLASGAHAYLTKPFDLRQFQSVLHGLLSVDLSAVEGG